MGGTIPDANFFFDGTNAKKRYLLDALMLTHGWRRFVWEDMLANRVDKGLMFEPEKGIMIEGKITSFKNKYQPKESAVSFNVLGEDIYQTKKRRIVREILVLAIYLSRYRKSPSHSATHKHINKKERKRTGHLS